MSPLRIWHYISVGGWNHSFTLRPSNVPRTPHLAFFWCNLAFTSEQRKRKRQQPLATHATCRPLGDWFAKKTGARKTGARGWECPRDCRKADGSLGKRRKNIYLRFLVNTNCIISSAVPWSPPPPPRPPSLRGWPNIRCHLSIKLWQAVTLHGIVRNDLNRPCIFNSLPLLVSLAIGL